jgi:hypothetical protein
MQGALSNEALQLTRLHAPLRCWYASGQSRSALPPSAAARQLSADPLGGHKRAEIPMLRGSCACGRVTYEIRGDLIGPVTYCHCWRCRKHSGSSFGTTAGVRAADFFVLSGEQLLSNWESSPGVHRFFASCCGSPIYKRQQATPAFFGFRLGTLDTDPSRKAELHFMVGSKAPWVELHEPLRQEPGGVPFGERD